MITPLPHDVTCAEIRRRVESLPDALANTLRLDAPALPERLVRVEHFEVTGIGASEGPARLLVELLASVDIGASFVPTVEFLRERTPRGRGLLVFSQGLSPNACLTLDRAERFAAALLFTAASVDEPKLPQSARTFAERGGVVWPHTPRREAGSLVRLVGPACALLGALRFVVALCEARGLTPPDWARELTSVPELVRAALAAAPELPATEPLAFLTASLPLELGRALAWKWQEALLSPLAPTFDLLSFVHGPVQSLHARSGAFLFCTDPAESVDRELHGRALALLDPTRHLVHELRATRSGPLGWFEIDATLDVVMLREMERRGLNPGRWPLQGRDSPLYGLGGEPPPSP